MRYSVFVLVAGYNTFLFFKDSTLVSPELLWSMLVTFLYFKSWSYDCITDLLLSSSLDTVLNCINRLTKLCKLTLYFFSKSLLSMGEIAKLFFAVVIWSYELSLLVIYNYDPWFTRSIWNLMVTHILFIIGHHL